ncbi:CCR4-NOT transcription complex subunit 3 [Nephila pilipes]|uniref:CCR4-NOT transcription complex subunit 3 n=1 Tax=Nephila pilipes TaxID=299642 RepID=A0A8X6QV94_NEPPI|nr:CCR4-NOT transcription complex subunit 3 [Nephila pilipes]
MADRRKLQSEVERCLKKVSEGVEAFEDTWKKVHCATNSNQKEKYEADLKKEIKKLQRLRDQIKTWLTSGDIKDKRPLQEARKTIEIQMERFKIVERETKTKAYSKEGLGAAQRLDPAQKEREDITSWLTVCIETLTIQVDKFESEMDAINLSLKKKKNDKEKLDRHEELNRRRGKHKYHINRLEALLRMLDNGTVEVDQIKKIKDDVEYYRDCSQEPDFHENEYLYDDLNVEDLDDYLAKQLTASQQSQQNVTPEEESSAVSNSPTSTTSNSRSHSPCLENHSLEESKIPESNSSNTIQQPPSPNNANNLSSECSSPASSHVNFHNSQPVINSQTSSTPYAAAATNMPNNHYKMSSNHESTWSSSNSLDEELSNDVNTKSFHCTNSSDALNNCNIHVSKSSVPVSDSWTYSNYNRYHFQDAECSSGMHCDSTNQNIFNNSDSQLHAGTETSKNVVSSVNCQNNNARSYDTSALLNISSNSVILDEAQSSLKNLAERAVLSNGMSNHVHNLPFSTIQNKGSQLTHIIFGNDENDIFTDSSLNILLKPSPSAASTEIDISQIFGQYPQNSFTEDQKHALSILEVASKHLPKPMDSLKIRYNGPGGPAPTPDYYPATAPNCNTIEFFQRLSTETLFFIFYFLQGTKAQYYAAKALKTKSWRFHTMFMMWFQRHEEPKTITDDFEQGTYVYFDFERWMQRKKEGFTFEYKYLEDKDLN